MTCIVGLEAEGRVIIGADSAGVSGYDLTVRADSKVFRNGPYVMGFASSFRMGQLLRYSLTPPAPPASTARLERFMATDFTDAVRTCLKAGGYAAAKEGREEGGAFLVGVAGHLVGIYSDYQVARSADGYLAVGCGADIALGALHATTHQPAQRRVRAALGAAAHYSAGVRPPFATITTRRGERGA